jgi:hypothetical protein
MKSRRHTLRFEKLYIDPAFASPTVLLIAAGERSKACGLICILQIRTSRRD